MAIDIYLTNLSNGNYYLNSSELPLAQNIRTLIESYYYVRTFVKDIIDANLLLNIKLENNIIRHDVKKVIYNLHQHLKCQTNTIYTYMLRGIYYGYSSGDQLLPCAYKRIRGYLNKSTNTITFPTANRISITNSKNSTNIKVSNLFGFKQNNNMFNLDSFIEEVSIDPNSSLIVTDSPSSPTSEVIRRSKYIRTTKTEENINDFILCGKSKVLNQYIYISEGFMDMLNKFLEIKNSY